MIRSFVRGVMLAVLMFIGFVVGVLASYVLARLSSWGGLVGESDDRAVLAWIGGFIGAALGRWFGKGLWPSTTVRVTPASRSKRTFESERWSPERWGEASSAWGSGAGVGVGTSAKSATRFSPTTYVYGKVGGTMDQAGFSDANVGAGLQGELMTSRMVEDVLARTGAKIYLFRGLTWPGSKNADVDFVLATARKQGGKIVVDIWMVDAKRWKRGDYRWDGTMTYLDGRPYHEIKFENAVPAMRKVLLGCHVHADVVIHGATSTRNDVRRGAMTIMTKDEFARRLQSSASSGSSGPLVELPVNVGQTLVDLVKVAS